MRPRPRGADVDVGRSDRAKLSGLGWALAWAAAVGTAVVVVVVEEEEDVPAVIVVMVSLRSRLHMGHVCLHPKQQRAMHMQNKMSSKAFHVYH